MGFTNPTFNWGTTLYNMFRLPVCPLGMTNSLLLSLWPSRNDVKFSINSMLIFHDCGCLPEATHSHHGIIFRRPPYDDCLNMVMGRAVCLCYFTFLWENVHKPIVTYSVFKQIHRTGIPLKIHMYVHCLYIYIDVFLTCFFFSKYMFVYVCKCTLFKHISYTHIQCIINDLHINM